MECPISEALRTLTDAIIDYHDNYSDDALEIRVSVNNYINLLVLGAVEGDYNGADFLGIPVIKDENIHYSEVAVISKEGDKFTHKIKEVPSEL